MRIFEKVEVLSLQVLPSSMQKIYAYNFILFVFNRDFYGKNILVEKFNGGPKHFIMTADGSTLPPL